MKGINVKKRLVDEGFITTIVGLVMLAFCGVLMYQEKQTTEQLSGWITTAMLFLRSKDSILFGEKKESNE